MLHGYSDFLFVFFKRHALQLTNSQQRSGGNLSPFSPKMAALIFNLKVHLRLYFPLDKAFPATFLII
jgi:hypothetical protein